VHADAERPLTISGRIGDDAKHYQIRAVRRALEEVSKCRTARDTQRALSGPKRANVTSEARPVWFWAVATALTSGQSLRNSARQ
jgi:hypothetical protein